MLKVSGRLHDAVVKVLADFESMPEKPPHDMAVVPTMAFRVLWAVFSLASGLVQNQQCPGEVLL